MKTQYNQTGKKSRRDDASGFSMEAVRVIHPHAAGIDIGSRQHFVAVPGDRDEQPVRSFGCFTPDLHAMVQWLKQCGIETVAMESTGVYWIPVCQVLEQYGMDVVLVDARHVKHVPGRKSDVQDCQWVQQLHSFGLLSGAFRPGKDFCVLRSYWRQRQSLVECCGRQINLMHKALEQMNLQLHKVLSDVTGVTGTAIIRAIAGGERDPVKLARIKHPKIKSSDEEVLKALSGDYRPEHVFALKQAVEIYDFYQQKIMECDREIERLIRAMPSRTDAVPKSRRGSRRRKNQPYFDLHAHLVRLTGVDLTEIDGIDILTAQTIVSECGTDMDRFPTEKHYVSWLGLSPNHMITGGKVKRRRSKRVYNRAAVAYRVAAQSLHKSQSALGAFYRRMRSRLGAPKAITAAARKLACLVYRMLRFGKPYVDQGQASYEERYKEQTIKYLEKKATRFGYKLIPLESTTMGVFS
jgi:transposase